MTDAVLVTGRFVTVAGGPAGDTLMYCESEGCWHLSPLSIAGVFISMLSHVTVLSSVGCRWHFLACVEILRDAPNPLFCHVRAQHQSCYEALFWCLLNVKMSKVIYRENREGKKGKMVLKEARELSNKLHQTNMSEKIYFWKMSCVIIEIIWACSVSPLRIINIHSLLQSRLSPSHQGSIGSTPRARTLLGQQH